MSSTTRKLVFYLSIGVLAMLFGGTTKLITHWFSTHDVFIEGLPDRVNDNLELALGFIALIALFALFIYSVAYTDRKINQR